MVKRKQLLKKVIAIASALAVISPIAVSAATLDTTTYTSEQPYQNVKDNTFLDTYDTFYANDDVGYLPICAGNGLASGTKGEPVTGGLGKAEDDNYYKLTTGDAAARYSELAYGGQKGLSFAGTTKDMYFTMEFYNPSTGGGQVEFRPCFGSSYDTYNYFNADGTITSDATSSDLLGKYELDKWNTVTMRVSNGDGSTKKYTKELYLNGEFVYRLPFASGNDMTRGDAGIRFTVATKNSTAYFDNVGIGLVADDKTNGSFVEAPVFADGGKFVVEGKTISYTVGATINDMLESIVNLSDFADGDNIAIFNAEGEDISDTVESVDEIASMQFKNGEYTRTYTLQGVASLDDKVWLNVDFDDDTPAVLSTKGTSTADDSSKAYINAIMTGNVGSASHNNKLATGNSSASFGTEIVSGAPGRAPGDNSLKLTLPAGGEQLNFEWTYDSKAISTSTSDFVFDFSVMIPSGSRVQIQPNLFYNAADAGITGGRPREWGISKIAVDTKNKITYNNTDITGKWTRIAYHITEWATVTNSALTADSGKYDVYVDGVKIAEDLSHSMPNIARLQFSLKVPAGNDANIYIDDIKMYTCKEDTPYFLDASKIAANYTDAEKYNLFTYNGKLTLSIDSANETVANARSVFGIQSVLASDGTVKADTATIARGSDKVTLKSKEGNIIYYYPTITSYMLVQGLPIYKTKDADTGKDKYDFGDRLQNLTKNEVWMRGYLAAYDSDGRLINCVPLTNGQGTTVLGAGANGGGVSFGTSKQSLVAENAETVRAYVWNANTYAPLVTAVKNVVEP